MKNPVRLSNKTNYNLFVYKYHNTSMFQLCNLLPEKTTVINIPYNSHIVIKKIYDNGCYLLPGEIIIDTHIKQNFINIS